MYLEKRLKDKPMTNEGIKRGNGDLAAKSSSHPVKEK